MDNLPAGGWGIPLAGPASKPAQLGRAVTSCRHIKNNGTSDHTSLSAPSAHRIHPLPADSCWGLHLPQQTLSTPGLPRAHSAPAQPLLILSWCWFFTDELQGDGNIA